MRERWADIPGFPGFEASTLGRIRNAASGRLKLLYVWRRRGYAVVLVCLGRRPSGSRGSRRVRVARCVLAAFRGVSDLLALHKDNDSTHCRLSNLRYGTHQDNADDRAKVIEAARRASARFMAGLDDEEDPQYVPARDAVAPF